VSCIFCRIASGEIPASVVYETEEVLAFSDLNPQAPVHVLVIPRRHVESLGSSSDEDRSLLGNLMLACRETAARCGIADRGYRVVLNTNADGGQTVPHLHAHVLGGRAMHWPPG